MSNDSTAQLQGLIDRLAAAGPSRQAAVHDLVGRVYRRTGLLARRIFRVSFPRLRTAHETGTVHHEALLRIGRALEQSQPATVAEFWALSTRIIRNTLVDLARRHDRSPARKTRSIDAPESRGGDSGGSLEPAACDDAPEVVESWTRMHERVASLPAAEREVFELCFYSGLSQRRAAEVLGRDPSTVNRLWRQAIEKLPALDL